METNLRPGSYQGNTLWRLGSAADGHHARRRYTIQETPTTDRTEGRDQEDHRTILFQVSESGSMILTAHSFLPSLAEMRLGWSLAVPRTRSVRASWCFPLREAIRPDRSGTCT